jgi:hypothetical protein
VYRAAVLFLTPEEPAVAAARVQEVDLRVKPKDAPLEDSDLVTVTEP